MSSNYVQATGPLVRDRETSRYLDLSYIHGYIDSDTDVIPQARPSHDSVLTSLIQLALLRLGAYRAFVSLSDSRYQYVIAETTAASSLRRPANQPTDQGLTLCGLAFSHCQGISNHVLQTAINALAGSTSDSQDQWKIPVCVIPDVQADDRFAARRLISTHKDVRFYAAVPIRSRAGPLIGVLSITDSKPRPDLSADEAGFLQDMSLTVMDHLTMIRHRQEEARGKRMMRGLGSFVEGLSTTSSLISDQWSRPEGDAGREGMLNVAQQASIVIESDYLSQEDAGPSALGRSTNEAYFDVVSSQFSSTSASVVPEQWAPSAEKLLQTPGHRTSRSSSPVNGFGPNKDEPRLTPFQPTAESSPAETVSLTPSDRDIRVLFSRAANIIRESIEVEGVLFFDASVATIGDTVDSRRRNSSDTGYSHRSYESSSEDSVRSSSSGRPARAKGTNTCDVLGFSTTGNASIDGDKPDEGYLSVPQRFLQLLLRRYPEGKIFNFDDSGVPLSDTESDSDHPIIVSSTTNIPQLPRGRHHRQRSYARSREPSFIIKIFPNARSVIAFPLWDSHRLRWFAGGVAWTRTANRVFSIKGELSYLRAFAATIMAGIAKIDAQHADRAKADVLGSISHELRSPLHGVLGGVELLQGTDMDVFQGSIAHTIERCGITLLDTISHLLDYAMVNNLIRTSRNDRQASFLRSDAQTSDRLERGVGAASWDVDVSTVVEEVVESVFAGYEFETSSESRHFPLPNFVPPDSNVGSGRGMNVPKTLAQNHVKVILDIRPAANWRFFTQVGALRRVVMNVFGNALKYTTDGYVRVTLNQKSLSNRSTPMSEVTIVVEDTGRGISPEYLAHHLFTPFSQEDSLSAGTGLGLSITHGIIKSLGGIIDAHSHPGRGTTMSITLPLHHTIETEVSERDDPFPVSAERTKGLRVCLSGFDEPDISAVSEKSPTKDWFLPRAVLARQCEAWLRMEVLPTKTAFQPDIYVATLVGAEHLAQLNRAGVVIQPVVVICPSAGIARNLSTAAKTLDRNGIFEYIAQPCGPRKLAKTFTLALDRWAATQVELATQAYAPKATSKKSIINTLAPVGGGHVDTMMGQPNPLQVLSNNLSDQLRQTASLPQRATSASPILASEETANIAPYLVVDDNAINLKLLTTYLRQQNLSVATASDGELAVAAYKAARGAFSCIFMDIQMPRLDGIAATRAIREYEKREQIQPVYIVVLTGLATLENTREAEASGANEVFSKPVRLKGLNPIIEKTWTLSRESR